MNLAYPLHEEMQFCDIFIENGWHNIFSDNCHSIQVFHICFLPSKLKHFSNGSFPLLWQYSSLLYTHPCSGYMAISVLSVKKLLWAIPRHENIFNTQIFSNMKFPDIQHLYLNASDMLHLRKLVDDEHWLHRSLELIMSCANCMSLSFLCRGSIIL